MKFEGKLEETGLLNLFMTLKTLEKTGFLEIWREPDNTASLYFENGELVNASYNTKEGEDAVFVLINWNSGEYKFIDHLIPSEIKIHNGSRGVYKEGMRKFFVYSILNKIHIKPRGKDE